MNGIDLYRAIGGINDDFILEAAQAQKRKDARFKYFLTAAACFCFIIGGIFAWKPWISTNPVRKSNAAEIHQLLGSDMGVPEGASDISYSIISLENSNEHDMAQAKFTLNNLTYTYRVLETSAPQDISGASYDWDSTAKCSIAGMPGVVSLANGAVGKVEWYSEKNGFQRCLLTNDNPTKDSLIVTADEIMETLGYDMDVAPKGSEDVTYSITRMGKDHYNDMAETEFTINGVHCSYRTLATDHVENITGIDKDWSCHAQAEIGWCSADLYWEEGKDGYILWYDAAPGLLYSLSIDSCASQDKLISMAKELYTPAQGDVG